MQSVHCLVSRYSLHLQTVSQKRYLNRAGWGVYEPPKVYDFNFCPCKSWFLSVISPAPKLTARVKVWVKVRVSVNNNNSGAGEITDKYPNRTSETVLRASGKIRYVDWDPPPNDLLKWRHWCQRRQITSNSSLS